MAKPKADPAADAATDDLTVSQVPDDAAEPVALPEAVRPVRDYGFIDDDGVSLYFRGGQSVTEPVHVAALVARGVELHPEG